MKKRFTENIKPKTAEKIQAQVESFADNNVKEFSNEQKAILKNAAELSKITDFNNLPDNLSDELIQLIEDNKETYLQFLKEHKYETEKIEESITLYTKKFSEIIADLKARMLESDPKKLPEYLGSGINGSAFKVEIAGKPYVAKFNNSVTQANFEIKPLLKAKGIKHVSQFVCHSFKDGVVIMELLPGTNITNFTLENMPEYTDKDIEQLIDTVVELESTGLMIDPKANNFLYSSEKGFSVLDYHLQKQNSRGHIIGKSIMNLIPTLTYRPHVLINPEFDNELNKNNKENTRRQLSMMIRVFEIVKNKYPKLITEWQQTYDREFAENKEKVRNGIYPQGWPYNPINKELLPNTNEFKQYIEKLENLGIKT